METDHKLDRKAQIEAAAYKVLEEHGFAAASMLKIARAASASNETLYRWYGDKIGLFSAMIQSNAQQIQTAIEKQASKTLPTIEKLRHIAPALLSVLLSKRAIELNRAAAADPTNRLGRLLAQFGRESIAPLILNVIQSGISSDDINAPSAETACDWFLSLLIGDLQIRRVIGGMPVPSTRWIENRANNATDSFAKLCANPIESNIGRSTL